MNKVDEQFQQERERVSQLFAPDTFEDRLKTALEQVPQHTGQKKTRYRSVMWTAAAATLFLLLGTYNYSGIAFYGQKILGYEAVTTETIATLHENGLGQVIGEKTTLSNGTTVTWDALLSDENQLILYYTLSNENGVDAIDEMFSVDSISGFFTNSFKVSSVSSPNSTATEVRVEQTFEPVNGFAKQLTFHYTENERDQNEITFDYDASKALNTTLKQSLQTTFNVDTGTISVQKLIATPTQTVFSGTLNVANRDRIHTDEIQLYANDQLLEYKGAGYTGGAFQDTFEWKFDALPKGTTSLTLVLKKYMGYENIQSTIPLNQQEKQSITIRGTTIQITNVQYKNDQTEITIQTKQNILLDGVSVTTKNGSTTELQTTIGQKEVPTPNGQLLERTMIFPTTKEVKTIQIEGLFLEKEYNQTFEVPL